MRITIDKRLDGIMRAASDAQRKKCTRMVAMRAKGVMENYVPKRTGMLRRSADLNSRYDAGEIVYSTPYAHRQYNLMTSNRTTPGTNGKWDEAAMRDHGDDLAEFAEAAVARVMNS